MKEIGVSELKRSDVLGSTLDDQLKINYRSMVGWINFLSCMQEKVLCPDAYLLTNANLVLWLHKTNCLYLKNGILVPILRKETLVNGKKVPLRDLAHLHEIYKEIGMYDGQITVDPEIHLLNRDVGPAIVGIHQRISESARKRRSIVLRNPSLQSEYQSICDGLEEIGITKRLKIETEWKEIIAKVKTKNNGIVPGRKNIYDEARATTKEMTIRRLADWVYYSNMNEGLEQRATIDYPNHVKDVAMPFSGQEKLLDQQVKKVLIHIDVGIFSEISPREIGEIREEYSPEWWIYLNKPGLSAQEWTDAFSRLYGRMLLSVKKASTTSKGDLIVKIVDAGVCGAGIFLTVSAPYNPAGYSLMAGELVWSYFKRLHAKRKERREALVEGRMALSNVH